MVRLLLDGGAEVDTIAKGDDLAVLIDTARGGIMAVFELLLRQVAGVNGSTTALIEAARKGDDALVRPILDSGASLHPINQQDIKALKAAIEMGHESTVTLLIDRGVSVKGQCEPLRCAASSEHERMVQLLLEYGADVNLGRYEYGDLGVIKMTPLHCAAWYGRDMAVRLLLEGGADTNARTSESFRFLNYTLTWLMLGLWKYYPSHEAGSVVMYAAMKGHTTTVQLLLDHGVDISIKDENEMAALDYASTRGFKKIEELLLKHSKITV